MQPGEIDAALPEALRQVDRNPNSLNAILLEFIPSSLGFDRR
jgi:hypothetical protein